MSKLASEHQKASPYQIFMLVLCIYAMAALAMEVVLPLDEQTKGIIDIADSAVCAFFFIDFLINMIKAPNKWQYFYRWGWIDLLSSIPTIDILRVGRTARILRIIRILRAFRAAKIIATFILERRKESAFMAAALVSILLIIMGSISVLHFEKGIPSANIQTAEDAIWWAVVTMTTVGFGDKYPVTMEGRSVAVMLMVCGVGLFGMFSGFIASWFLSPGKVKEKNDLEIIRQEIEELKRMIGSK
jgi:voltage-gated potassium channel